MTQSNSRDEIVARVTQIAERVGERQGIEIVEVEFLGGGKSRTLRIFIDRLEGVTHSDCELITREVGAVLDAEDVIPGEHYNFEVSSPGVERKLTKLRDYERFTGQKAKIVLTEPVEDQKFWEGTIRRVEGNRVTLEPSEGKLVEIPLDIVRKANLKFDW